MSDREIITPRHPRWQDFVERLSHACICVETTENARRVLSAMGRIDVEATLVALRALGGTCDCAIVFEVAGVPERYSA
jgi:hypothetical protein